MKNNESTDKLTQSAGIADFLSGSGEMAAQMRAKDWSQTSLGNPSTWPQSLKTIVRIILDSRYSMWMGWGPELTFIYNDAYARDTLGKKHPWALGRPAREVWAEIWSDIGPRIDRVLSSGEASWDEGLLLFLERSGFPEETYHTFSYSPLYDDQGHTAGMFCVVTEETERVIAERRVSLLRDLAATTMNVKVEQELFAGVEHCLNSDARDLPFTLTYLLEDQSDAVSLVATSGISRDAAASASDPSSLWHFAQALDGGNSLILEILPPPFNAVRPPEWPKSAERAFIVPITQQGQTRPAGFFVAGLNPHRALDDAYKGFINLAVGQISSALANVRAYEAERRRAEALMELDRAKTVFFSNVSHELRTPLTLMLGPLDDALSQAEEPLPARTSEELKTVQRNGRRLLKLVNTLLDFSRIEAGRMPANLEPCDLAAYTAELASVFRSAIEKSGMKLVVDCPALSQPVCVDRSMWEKVVLNLLSNAYKYSLQGTITVALHQRGNAVELAVTDTGSGIPESEIPRLFERFHRVQGTKGRTHEGAGIGLALVHELVKLHDGSVEAQSVLGQGSTFRVRIPMGAPHLPAGPTPSATGVPMSTVPDAFIEEAREWTASPLDPEVPAADAQNLSPTSQARRVVFADDNPDMRRYVTRLLQSHGFTVEAVPDGQAALDAIRRQHADLVLTDVMMPRMDGFQLLRALRSDSAIAAIPVVLLSARAGEEATVEGLQAGADDYLVKPFSARELVAKLEGRLALVQARRQFETLLSEAPLGAYVVDADFRIRQVNRAAQEVFRDVPDLIGRDFEEVIRLIRSKNYADEIIRLFRHTLKTGETYLSPERVAERFDHHTPQIYEWQLNRITMPDGGFGVVCYFREISHHYYARQAAADAERQLRLVTDHAPVLIAHCDTECRYKFVNKPYAERFGITPADVVGKTLSEVLGKAAFDGIKDYVATALAGNPVEFELEIPYAVGGPFFMHAAYAPERNADGKVVGFVAAITNIGERKRAERILQRSREQIDIVVRGANVGVWYCPLPFDKLIWDAKVKEHFHLAPDAEVTIDTFYNRIHPEDRQRTRSHIETSIAERRPYDIDYRTVSPDGNSIKWIRASGRGFYDDDGNPTRFDGITIDITHQKRAEETERQAALEAVASAQVNAKFRTFFEQGSYFAGVMSLDGTLIEANRLCLEACGFSREKVIGRKFWDCGWWSPSSEHMDMIREGCRTAASGQVFRRESTYFIADGSQRMVDLTIAPILDADGTVLFIAPTGVDITDRKRLADDRERLLAAEREARADAERANRLKEDFLTTLSHELRTPLNAILGWTQILEQSPNDAETINEGIAVIARNARAQTQLIEDLLDMSRITSGKLRLAVQEVDLSEVIVTAVESVRPAADAREIRLVQVLDSMRCIITGDPHRLQQVIWNLLSNAIKFTPKGGRVQVVLQRVNSYVELRVIDNGQGISPEFLPHVFERFRQADGSTRRSFGGLGLGLAIVKQLVELHGGTVRASSPGEGAGSVFVVTLPLAVMREPDEPVQQDKYESQERAKFTSISLDGVKVLVIDDEPDARNLVRRILDGCNATVTTASSAAEALRAFRKERPDVILSDIGMPDVDGYELMRMIRSLGSNEGGLIPAAALTAYARPEDRRQALIAGFQSHIVKPADAAELITVVASLAGKLARSPEAQTSS